MKKYGAFNLFFTHTDNEDPAMVLASNPFYIQRKAWVIPLNEAYRYADSKTGQPTSYLEEAAKRIGSFLGIGVDKYITYKIASAIVDNLPDLIRMPPLVKDKKREFEKFVEQNRMKVKMNGETIIDAT